MQSERISPDSSRGKGLDPFSIEIIRSALVATTDEMKTNLMRTSYNAVVYEALDFTVAVTDPAGNLVSIGLGLPSFIRGISDTVKAFVKHFGSDIHPGDVLMTNDSYTHGSHLNHMIMALPVFNEGQIVAFSCSEPHWADIGGLLGGSPTDIYSEGLQLPYLKIYKRGELDNQITRIIQANVRNPELAMGDFRGQVACVRTGEKRILHLARKYGNDGLRRAVEIIFDNSEALAKRRVREIPEGTYEAEQFMDDDGIDIGKHIPIKVKIIVRGDRMTVDLSGVSRQVRGYYNSRAGVSGAQMGFKSVLSPLERPVNDGTFRAMDAILPSGTVVSAEKPAAMRMWMIIPMTIADTMWKALSTAVPEWVGAGHHGDFGGAQIYPVDPATGRPVLRRTGIVGGLIGGGFGAVYNADGQCATICMNDGDTHNNPIESGEAHDQSVLSLGYYLRQDSGGAGKFRGGLGAVRELVFFTDGMLNSYTERTSCPPWGALGGRPGAPNSLELDIPTKKLGIGEGIGPEVLQIPVTREQYPNAQRPNAKVTNRLVPAGVRIVSMVGGGGGFGDPFKRDPKLVLDDVLNGYVSVEAAKSDYGVVIDTTRMQVDDGATRRLRA